MESPLEFLAGFGKRRKYTPVVGACWRAFC
jgi:hypothetical protein